MPAPGKHEVSLRHPAAAPHRVLIPVLCSLAATGSVTPTLASHGGSVVCTPVADLGGTQKKRNQLLGSLGMSYRSKMEELGSRCATGAAVGQAFEKAMSK